MITRQRAKLYVVGVIGILALAVGFLLAPTRPMQAADTEASSEVPVTTDHAKIQDVPVLLSGLGTVQPLNVVEIKAQVNGTLIALPIKEGQEVRKDQIVAEIDPRPYQAALDQALAQRDEDTAVLQSAQLDLKRYQSLAKSSFAPIQQVDDQQATVNKQIAAVALDNAAIETARINLDYCVIRAPFDGRIGFFQVTVGNVIQVASQTGIISVSQTKPISVVFTLPEADLPAVERALGGGGVPVTAYDSTAKRSLAQGTLMTPNNLIDTTTGTISLKATFPNADNHLWPGQFVDTRVQVGLLRQAVTVPLSAVEHGPDGTFVYVVNPNGMAEQVNVQVGTEWDGWQVVTKGLTGTETVVVGGQSRLAPGTAVKATAASGASSSPT